MIDIEKLKAQIMKNLNRVEFEKARKQSKEKDIIGGYAKEFADAVLKSDIRMYKREIFAFNGKYYENFDFAIFRNMMIEMLLDLNAGYGLIVKNNIDLVEFCKTRLIMKDINPNRNFIPFQNYVLDTESLITYPHNPEMDLLYALPYDYEPTATCPKWLNFLEQVLPSAELRFVLQEYLGLLFVNRDRTKLEKMLILYGGGANGKSVVFETIIRILGEENCSMYDMAQLTRGKASEANLADIDGKILNYASDLDPHDFSGGIAKRLISGEKMQARKLYKDPMVLKMIPLFIANANELPETTDRTKGFFRRMLILPFNVTIEEEKQDKQLSTKLRDEYPGILNWILEGTVRIVKNGINFTPSKDVEKASEEYKIIQDSVYGFIITNRLKKSEEKGCVKYLITNNDLHEQYEKYCNEVTKKPYGKNRFLQIFKSQGFQSYKLGTDRGITLFCDRPPHMFWNVDVGNIYDDENQEEIVPVEVGEFEGAVVQGDLPF